MNNQQLLELQKRALAEAGIMIDCFSRKRDDI